MSITYLEFRAGPNLQMQNSHLIASMRTVFDRQGSCIRQKYSTLPKSPIKKKQLQIPGVCKFSRYRSVLSGRLNWTAYTKIRVIAITCIWYANIYQFRKYVLLINPYFEGVRKKCYVTKYYHHYKRIPKITLLVSICCPVSDFDESVMYRHPKCLEQKLQKVFKREIWSAHSGAVENSGKLHRVTW